VLTENKVVVSLFRNRPRVHYHLVPQIAMLGPAIFMVAR